MTCDDEIKGSINDVYSSTPWVEKYRPTHFDDIVLDDINKKILLSIIENNYFPNLLLYGPPGTGKTTTSINLVNAYQEKYHQKNNHVTHFKLKIIDLNFN